MEFSRTTDMSIVRDILTESQSWRRMCDDSAPAPRDFAPSVRNDLDYILCRHHQRIVALFLLKLNYNGAEVHFCVVPESWGRARTARIGREFLEWVWRETSIDWLLAPVPSHNRLALKLAEICGFERFGEELGCLTKNGQKYDRILLSVSRRRANAAV